MTPTKHLATIACALAIVGTAGSAHAEYTVRGKGRLVYRDGDGNSGPLRPNARVKVQLMDQDIDFDEVMAVGKTDADGRFDLTGKAEDSWTVCGGCDKPDPYMKFILWENDRVDIHNLWGFTHFGVTNAREDRAGTIDFGEWRFEADEQLYPRLFAYAQKQYLKFSDLSGDSKIPRNDGMVAVLVPEIIEGGVPYTGIHAIHWPGDYFDASAVYHEFGHRIRHAQDGGEGHFIGDVILFQYARTHGMYVDGQPYRSNLGFAFNEGWAIYHSTFLDSDTKEMVEQWTPRSGGSADEYEGEVAYRLLRLSKACGGFRALWSALKSGTNKSIDGGPPAAQTGIHSWPQFETWFMQKNPTCKIITNIHPAQSAKLPFKPEKSTSVPKQKLAIAGLLDSFDAAPVKVRVKWDATRIATLPAAVRGPMTRVTDKRVALFTAHEANVRKVLRDEAKKLAAATDKSMSDGTRDKELAAMRDAILKATGKPRMKQLAELKATLLKEKNATRDRRFIAYAARLIARYTAQENEIRAALATPGARIPDALLPRSLGATMTNVATD
jgi:hypothetical protein